MPLIYPVSFLTAGGVAGGTRTVAGTANSTTNTTSYTFTAVDISTASATRYVVVGLAARTTADTVTISSVTLGGNTMTKHAEGTGTFSGFYNAFASVYGYALTTGTTADIVVTGSGANLSHAVVQVYALYDLNSNTPTATGSNGESSGATSVSTTANVNSGGIAVCVGYAAVAEALTMVGADEDADATYEGVGAAHFGSKQSMAAETPRTFSSSSATSIRRAIAAVTWR